MTTSGSPDDIASAFSAASQAHAEGALVTEESMFIVHRALIDECLSLKPDVIAVTTAKASQEFAEYKEARKIGDKYAKFRAYVVEGLRQ